MIKSTVEDFVDLVCRSGLVEPEQLDRLLEQMREEVGPGRARDRDCLAAKLVEVGLLTPWQCERLLQGLYRSFFLKGKTYKVLDHLGSGGMSHVFLAEHTLMQRRVAIKVLPKNRVKDSSYLARFRREARAIAALDHRNIVRAYDIDREGDTHYLVMEYVDGRDLQAIVKEEGPLSCGRAVEYVRQAAEGLEHAHRAGLIHRDIKPANLLVDRNGVVKLLDLGLAKFSDEGRASLTVTYDENILGTADYLAPEQAMDSHAADPRADIYSLGCTLFYLLTGHAPYPNGTLPQRLLMHQKSPPPDVRQERLDVPEELAEVCKRMMAKKADARYQSAGQVAEILAAWLEARGFAGDSSVRKGTTSNRPTLPGNGAGSKAGSAKSRGSGSRLAAIRQATALTEGHSASRSPSGVDSRSSNGGKPSPSSGVVLPIAERLEETVSEDALSDDLDVLGDTITSGIAIRIGRGKESLSSVSDEEFAAYRQRRRQVPIWLWAALSGGVLLAIGLAVLTAILAG